MHLLSGSQLVLHSHAGQSCRKAKQTIFWSGNLSGGECDCDDAEFWFGWRYLDCELPLQTPDARIILGWFAAIEITSPNAPEQKAGVYQLWNGLMRRDKRVGRKLSFLLPDEEKVYFAVNVWMDMLVLHVPSSCNYFTKLHYCFQIAFSTYSQLDLKRYENQIPTESSMMSFENSFRLFLSPFRRDETARQAGFS